MAGEPGPVSKEDNDRNTRCGFIAVIGAPNAGKSTLVNALVGTKVTIVSHKVQTTRTPIRGIALSGKSQLVFIDTPGIFQPRRKLDKAMVEAAWGGAWDADVVALLVDAAKGVDDDVERILDKLSQVRCPLVLVLNKVDRVSDKQKLLALAEDLNTRFKFAETFMISAFTANGVEALKSYLAASVPEGPWHYPEDEISDAPVRMLAAEITREKLYSRLHQELPYSAAVETTSWKKLRDKSVRIEQTIYVERDGQKKIVLGKNGSTIKQISSEARAEITEIVGSKVHLFLFVKVRQAWANDPERYRQMGLEYPKE